MNLLKILYRRKKETVVLKEKPNLMGAVQKTVNEAQEEATKEEQK
jgi:hypothetical protein